MTKEERSEHFRRLNAMRKTRGGGRKGKRTRCRWCMKVFPSRRQALAHQGKCRKNQHVKEEKKVGAMVFYNKVEGGTMSDAFSRAVQDAEYDYGHSGYTGTIAEKSSVVRVGEAESWVAARKMADKLIDDDDARVSDKWGPAGCIEVKDRGWYFFGWASS